jgi:hypothetical protein
VRLAARRRLQILKLLDKIMCYKIFMWSKGFLPFREIDLFRDAWNLFSLM